MASMLDEHPAFSDTAGLPLVNGEVFIGVVDLDPVLNPTPIFSDAELTVALANPQTIDAFGQATNKIYIPGKYSMRVDDSLGVQQYQNLDNGEDVAGGTSTVTGILGTNTITGNVQPTAITAYTDSEIYIYQAFGANTGAVTQNWDAVGAKALVYDFNIPLEENHIEAGQTVVSAFNAAEDNFQWLNVNRKVIYGVEAASIATSSTVDLGTLQGNSADLTGTTTVTSFGTTPDGSEFWLTMATSALITFNASSLIIPGGASYQTSGGDLIRVQSRGGGNNAIQVFKVGGQALSVSTVGVRQIVSTLDGAVAALTTVMPFDDSVPQITEGDEVMTVSITPEFDDSNLLIQAVGNFNENPGSGTRVCCMGLFVDSTANALAAAAVKPSQTDSEPEQIIINHTLTSGSTTARTYRVRMGPETTATFTFNGENAVRRFGGVMASSIIVTEISIS